MFGCCLKRSNWGSSMSLASNQGPSVGGRLTKTDRDTIFKQTKNEKIRGTVNWIWNEKLDIDATNEDGVALFYVACQEQNFEVAEYLLGIGADPNMIPPDGMPAWSFMLSTFEEVKKLREEDARIRFMKELHMREAITIDDRMLPDQFRKCLIVLCNSNLEDVVKYMIERCSLDFLERKDSNTFPLFTNFCIHNSIDIVRMLLEKGCSPNRYDFFFAFLKSDLAVVRSLCTERLEVFRTLRKVDVISLFLRPNRELDEFIIEFVKTMNLMNISMILFHLAAILGHSDFVKTILESFPKQSFIDAMNDDLFIYIFTASTAYRTEARLRLLFHTEKFVFIYEAITRISSNKWNFQETSFLDYTVTLDSTIKAAVGNGGTNKINEVFEKNETRVIAKLVVENRLDVVETLLKYHYQTFKNPLNWPLDIDLMCCAVSSCDYEMVRLLTEQGEDVNRLHKHFLTILYAGDSTGWLAPTNYSSSYPIFFCALARLSCTPLHFLDEVFEENPNVEDNIIKIITDFADATLFSQMYNKKLSVMSMIMDGLHQDHYTTSNRIDDEYASYGDENKILTEIKIAKYFGLRFKLLKLFVSLGSQFINNEAISLEEPSISDFLVSDEMTRAVSFYLFQAGAYAHSRYVIYPTHTDDERDLCDVIRKFSDKRFTKPPNINLCKVLVMEKLQTFERGVSELKTLLEVEVQFRESVEELRDRMDIEDFEELSEYIESGASSVIKDPLNDFLKWYDDVTSSPFSLQCRCRTLIRRILSKWSDRRSILPKIDSLDLPNKLKQYLKYEGSETEIDLGQ